MPPDLDATAILRVLARHRVRCVVVGAVAAQMAGAALTTRDVDITPATTPENLERLAAALAELDAAIRTEHDSDPVPLPPDPRLLARGEIWNLTTRYGDLDVIVRPAATDGYEDLRRGSRSMEVGRGLVISVASLEDVIRSKAASNRPKDHKVLPLLREALERSRAYDALDLDI